LQFLTGDDFTWMFEEDDQNLQWLILQLDLDAFLWQFTRIRIQLESAETLQTIRLPASLHEIPVCSPALLRGQVVSGQGT
jgi:hypothetical protein